MFGFKRLNAVFPVNWISPIAPDPAPFGIAGLNVSRDSNAMILISQLGSTPSLRPIWRTRSANAVETLAPHARGAFAEGARKAVHVSLLLVMACAHVFVLNPALEMLITQPLPGTPVMYAKPAESVVVL